MSAHINTNQNIALVASHTIHGYRVCHTTIDEYHAITMHRLIERRQRDACTNGIKKTAFAEHHLTTGFQVGSYCTIGDWQVFDRHIRHELHDGLDDARALDDMIKTQREVRQFEHLLTVYRLHPFTELLQFPCCIDAPDESSHRTTSDRGDAIALCLQFLDGTDMGKSSCTSARQY